MPETEPISRVASFIVRTRVKELAKSKGKCASSSFLAYLDREIRDMVEQACHMVGSRTIIKAGEYEQYRILLRRYGGK